MTPSDLKKEKQKMEKKKHGNEPQLRQVVRRHCARARRVKNLMTPTDLKKRKTKNEEEKNMEMNLQLRLVVR